MAESVYFVCLIHIHNISLQKCYISDFKNYQ